MEIEDPHNAVDGILSLLDDIDRALNQVRALADRLRQVREAAQEHAHEHELTEREGTHD